MASIHKDGADATWRAAVTCIVGSARLQVKKTTGTTDRKLARRIADFLEELAAGLMTSEEAHGFLAKIAEAKAKRATRRAADELLRMTTGRSLGGESLRTFATGWLARTQGEVVVRSIEKYRTAVLRFLELIGERADANLQEIETRDVVAFRDALAKRLAPSSVNVELKIIRSMFAAAERDLLISRNPARLVKSLKVPQGHETRRAFTIQELGRIYAATCGEMRGLFLAGLFTGQRLGDIARWRWVNVDFERDEIRFTTRKTGRRQIIPLAGPLRDWLLSEGSPGDDLVAPVFPKSFAAVDAMRDGSVGLLSNRFYRVLAEAGLAPVRPHKRRDCADELGERRRISTLGFHSLRYSATSLMKAAGVSEAVAMDIIGHESEAVSAHYTQIDEAAKRSALAKLPGLDVIAKAAAQSDRGRPLP